MKRAIMLGSALSVLGLMLVSCSSEPSVTSATTRQTMGTTPDNTGSTPVHPPSFIQPNSQGTTSHGY